MLNQILSILKISALALALSIGLSYAFAAWAPPTQLPPNGNTPTPINVATTTQTKIGGDICSQVGGITKCLQTVSGGASLPSGVAGQTLRNVGGTSWATSSLIFNNGTNVGIGTTAPTQKLEVDGGLKISNRFILPKTGAWSGDVLEVHTSGWDGSSNNNYGTVVGGHGYYYGGLQSGGASGNEAAAGELYVSGKSTLYGQVVGPSYGGMLSIAGGGDGWYGMGQSTATGGATAIGGYYPYAINMHTGLAFSAHSAYGGIRFYNQPYPTAPMSSTPVMQIINNNVGIGTAAPGYKLDVSGNSRVTGSVSAGSVYSTGLVQAGSLYDSSIAAYTTEVPVAAVDTSGNWPWTRVVSSACTTCGTTRNGGVLLSATLPVLGIRISGPIGSICTANISGLFHGGVANSFAYFTDLDIDYMWSGYAVSNGAFPTAEFIFDKYPSGRTLGSQDLYNYIPKTAWNKAAGLTHVRPGQWLSYSQWSYGTQSNTCYIDVLYGDYK